MVVRQALFFRSEYSSHRELGSVSWLAPEVLYHMYREIN